MREAREIPIRQTLGFTLKETAMSGSVASDGGVIAIQAEHPAGRAGKLLDRRKRRHAFGLI
jgi:hypothetical protein